MRPPNRYAQIINRIFLDRFRPGDREVLFARPDLETTAAGLGVVLPKNLGACPAISLSRCRRNGPGGSGPRSGERTFASWR
jgi:hypothetical protein